jgi:hypothetical protein
VTRPIRIHPSTAEIKLTGQAATPVCGTDMR